jgi:hypothetical protein
LGLPSIDSLLSAAKGKLLSKLSANLKVPQKIVALVDQAKGLFSSINTASLSGLAGKMAGGLVGLAKGALSQVTGNVMGAVSGAISKVTGAVNGALSMANNLMGMASSLGTGMFKLPSFTIPDVAAMVKQATAAWKTGGDARVPLPKFAA